MVYPNTSHPFSARNCRMRNWWQTLADAANATNVLNMRSARCTRCARTHTSTPFRMEKQNKITITTPSSPLPPQVVAKIHYIVPAWRPPSNQSCLLASHPHLTEFRRTRRRHRRCTIYSPESGWNCFRHSCCLAKRSNWKQQLSERAMGTTTEKRNQ